MCRKTSKITQQHFCCSHDIQTQLMRSCWSELFTLGLAQCSETINLSTILSAIQNHIQNKVSTGNDLYIVLHRVSFIYLLFIFAADAETTDRVREICDVIMRLQKIIISASALKIDRAEFAFLKTLVLLNPGKLFILTFLKK